MGDRKSNASNIRGQINANNYRTTLLKALAAGLVALISLSQLGTAARFGSGGPAYLLPATVSAVVAAAVLFGLAYGNFGYATATLEAELTKTNVSDSSSVPQSEVNRTNAAKRQMTWGVIVSLIGISLYLASVWWPH